MTAEATTMAGRVFAEAQMVDACQVTRPSGKPVLSEVSLQLVDPPPTVVYSGKCRVGDPHRASNASDTESAGRLVFELGVQVSLPIAVVGVRVHDTVTVTASVLDPSLVDRRFAVQVVEHKSFLTARRLTCVEIVT